MEMMGCATLNPSYLAPAICLFGVSSINRVGPCAGYTRLAPRSRRRFQVAKATGLSKAQAPRLAEGFPLAVGLDALGCKL